LNRSCCTTAHGLRPSGSPPAGRPREKERLRVLLSRDHPGNPGHELLRAIDTTGRWIEQEAFSDETLRQLAAGRTA
jgi:hypothetical protein